MKVYRVERVEDPFSDREYTDADDHWCDLPDPNQEGIGIEADEYCGCISKRQLNIWWKPKDYKTIIQAGMAIRVLEVPDKYVRVGQKQVVFKRKKAKVIGEYTVDNKLRKIK